MDRQDNQPEPITAEEIEADRIDAGCAENHSANRTIVQNIANNKRAQMAAVLREETERRSKGLFARLLKIARKPRSTRTSSVLTKLDSELPVATHPVPHRHEHAIDFVPQDE